jgi:hypothetical protein
MEALVQLDRNWEATGYQFATLEERAILVRIGRLPYWTWTRITEVARRQSSDTGNGALSGITATARSLDVRTTSPTLSMEAGHHLSLWRSSIQDTDTIRGNAHLSVEVFWRPPEGYFAPSSEARGARGYWGCETTVNWIRRELIPACLTEPSSTGALSWMAFGRRTKASPPDEALIEEVFFDYRK